MPRHIGYEFDGKRISHVAYADDVSLISTTILGLQLLINRFRELVLLAGIEINTLKTRILALRACGRERQVIPYSPAVSVDESDLFLIESLFVIWVFHLIPQAWCLVIFATSLWVC